MIIIIVMIKSIKSNLNKSKKNIPQRVIVINLNGQSLICLIQQQAMQIYGEDHQFYKEYLFPYFQLKNQQLIKEFTYNITSINDHKYLSSQLPNLLQNQINKHQSYLSLVKQFWYSYMQSKIKKHYDTTKFFRMEVAMIVDLMLKLLITIYKDYHINNPQQVLKSIKFKIQVIQGLTDSYQFQKIKTVFVKKFKLGCGMNGDFTPSQIELTTMELDQLVKFKQIPAPFHQSIGLMMQFYKEYRLKEKVNLLVKVVEQAKSQILQYRQFFSMGNAVIGSDQIMPIINFICQKTNKNIYASVQYIRALLGGIIYNDEQCRLMLREIQKNSQYCLDLVESMASIWCHASKMMI